MSVRASIKFRYRGRTVELTDVGPMDTLLEWLRLDQHAMGTKEGCGEGDCGACTIALGSLRDGKVVYEAVNACILLLGMIDGKELVSVDDLTREGTLHPVQQAMVDTHGSQCGFCTPGFVMSLFTLSLRGGAVDRSTVKDQIAGTLCRCTGYRPIIAAAHAMYDVRPRPDKHFNPDMLRALARDYGVRIQHGEKTFFAPATVEELVDVLAEHPDATILAGGTDVGLWVTKQHLELKSVIYLGRVAGLNAINVSESHIEIGAAVTLSDAMPVIIERYPGLDELFRRFASPPIRNAGTLVGNIANGSPIGDSMPALMVAGATLVLRRGRSQREIPLEAFYLDYQLKDLRPSEFVEFVRIPLPGPGVIVRSHKLSKRFDQDISAVCNAYRLELDGEQVRSFRMACGGMAATIKRAEHCEAAINGKDWNEATVATAMDALTKDFTPITDMRASADYRLRAAQNLLKRFYLETCGDLEATVYTYGRQG